MTDCEAMRDAAAGGTRTRAVVWILAGAFALRAGLMLLAAFTTSGPTVHYAPDSAGYVAVAREFAATGRFTRGGEPELARTPGYPLLLAPGVLSGRTEAVTITLQILLSCATVYAVYGISRLVFEREAVARFCAALYAVEPLSVLYANKLLSETLFAFVFALALWGLVAYLKSGGRWALIGSAVALAASIYVRPVAYFLPPLVAVGLAVRAFRKPRAAVRTRLLDAVLFVAVSMALVGAWQVRNAVEAGYTGFAAIGDENLYFYQGASVLAAQEGKSYYRVQKDLGYHDPALFQLMHLDQENWTRAEKYRWLRREGLKTVLAHPTTYAWIHAKGMARLMLDPGGFEYLRLLEAYPASGGLLGEAVDSGLWSVAAKMWRERRGAFLLNATLGLVLLGYLGLALLGALRRGFWSNAGLVALLFTAAYLVLMSGGPQAEGRFRHPVMLIVCVLAGAGWVMLTRRRTQPRIETAS